MQDKLKTSTAGNKRREVTRELPCKNSQELEAVGITEKDFVSKKCVFQTKDDDDMQRRDDTADETAGSTCLQKEKR